MGNLINSVSCEAAVKKIANGDISAIGTIYNHMYRQIYSVSWAILRNHEDAEDNLQNTLCEICKSSKSYTSGNVRAWILSIARHQALNMVKTRHSCDSLEDYEKEVLLSFPESSFDTSFICFEALSSLNFLEREIVIYKLYVGLKHREIANILGISVASAEKTYQRALHKLKNYFKE